MCRCIIALLFSLVAVMNSGCVLEPLNGGSLQRNGTTRVHGFYHQPKQEILIQAWDLDRGVWETIAQTRSSGRAIQTGFAPFPGSDSYYYWDAGDVAVPGHLWIGRGQWDAAPGGYDEPRWHTMCCLRAVTRDGQVLPSYNERPNLFADPVQEWVEKGNRESFGIFLYEYYD